MSSDKSYKCSLFIQRLLYPPCCLLCESPGISDSMGLLDLCPACWSELPRITKPCPVCGLPLPAGADPQTRCGQCQQRQPAYDQLCSLFAYQGAARFLIHQLKYQQKMAHGRLLGSLLGRQLHQQTSHPEYIIPVPLHPKRQRQRGFNQSLEIARPISRHLQIPILQHCCSRIRDTPSQSSLNARQRRQNLHKAFRCSGLQGATHIALLDDVVTTAATVEALSRLLRQHGAQRIDVWTVARA